MIYRVRLNPELIPRWFETGAKIRATCVRGLPAGAKFNDVSVLPSGDVMLTFETAKPGGEVNLIPVYETGMKP